MVGGARAGGGDERHLQHAQPVERDPGAEGALRALRRGAVVGRAEHGRRPVGELQRGGRHLGGVPRDSAHDGLAVELEPTEAGTVVVLDLPGLDGGRGVGAEHGALRADPRLQLLQAQPLLDGRGEGERRLRGVRAVGARRERRPGLGLDLLERRGREPVEGELEHDGVAQLQEQVAGLAVERGTGQDARVAAKDLLVAEVEQPHREKDAALDPVEDGPGLPGLRRPRSTASTARACGCC